MLKFRKKMNGQGLYNRGHRDVIGVQLKELVIGEQFLNAVHCFAIQKYEGHISVLQNEHNILFQSTNGQLSHINILT